MPTEGEKLKIRRLLAAGRSYEQIAGEMGGAWRAMHVRSGAISDGYVKPKSSTDKAKSKFTIRTNGEFGVQAAGIKMDYVGAQPKPDMIEERNRAYAHEQSLTARIFGDPRSGRSALDRKRMEPVR